jgi:hypothetical protein
VTSRLLRNWRALLTAVVVVRIAIGGLSYVHWKQTVLIASMAINYVRYWSAPAGTLETEAAQTGAAAQPSAPTASAQAAPGGAEADWPSYNKTLTSDRFSLNDKKPGACSLSEIPPLHQGGRNARILILQQLNVLRTTSGVAKL